jgi:hypothetical protein
MNRAAFSVTAQARSPACSAEMDHDEEAVGQRHDKDDDPVRFIPGERSLLIRPAVTVLAYGQAPQLSDWRGGWSDTGPARVGGRVALVVAVAEPTAAHRATSPERTGPVP